MDNTQISNEELNQILLKYLGKKQFVSESVPFLLRWMVKSQLPLPKHIKEIEALIKSFNYVELYNKLHHDRMVDNKRKWYYDCCLIVLCYFKLNKHEEAGELIEAQSHITYSLPQVILNIAQKLGVKYIPRDSINRE